MAEATLNKTLQGHTEEVYCVAVSPDSKLIASASMFSLVALLWNIPNGDLNAGLKGHSGVSSVAFSPDGKSIVTGSVDKTVRTCSVATVHRTWSVATKQEVQILNGHSDFVWSVAWSPNGALIASGSQDKTVILWDAISLSMKKKLTGHTNSVMSVSFSPNGNKLASAGDDYTAIIWDVNSGAALIKLAHSFWVFSVCFSHDNQFVVTGCHDKIVRMFNVNTGREEKQFMGHNYAVLSVACSFDGSMIASGSSDNSVRLWDVASTKQLQQLDGHTDHVASVAFSRDGKFIASGSYDKTICLWNAPSSLQTPTSLLKSACFVGDVNGAKFQLDQGALVNNKDGLTALYAASSKGSKELVELLIERGADIKLRNQNGSSALHAASYHGHIELVCYFLDRGLPIDDKGNGESTALHLASSQGHKEVVELLVQRGADVNSQDSELNNAFYYACISAHLDVAHYLLLRCNSLVNEKTSDGSTLLHKAIDTSNIEFVRLLLQRGADVNIVDGSNQSALQLANQSKSAEIEATFNQATHLQSIPASVLDQTAQFTLRLNKFGPDVWDTLSSSVCAQFLVGLFLQSNPYLGTIPDSVAQLGQLLCISVADCGLSASSIRALSLLPNLRSLDVSSNLLGDLPGEFSQLKELRILNVNQCNLSLVPAVIMKLSQLRELDISNNPLHGLPSDLGYLPLLTKLTLTDCPMTTIPYEYHDSSTFRLLQFLRDSQESEAVYRSKLLLVGYGEVGKTTLLTSLFPLRKKEQHDDSALMYEIRGQTVRLYSKQTVREKWQLETEIDLSGATVMMNEIGWSVQPANSTTVYKFHCKDALERDEWVRTCQFLARNARTDGISAINRRIKSEELDSALRTIPATTPYHALFEYVYDHKNKVPSFLKLELNAWDFAGQFEYQDGHQLFLMSRAIYLVLWDVTPSKRKQELAKLRHWLMTLQLHLGTTDNNMRSSVLVYIVGTHVDCDDDFLLEPCLEQVKQALIECNFTLPHRIVDPIDARNQDHVSLLKNQLLADMAVQSHLGELVPQGYLQIERYLLDEQRKYRLNMLQGGKDASTFIPIMQRQVLSERCHRDIPYVTRALELFNLWGSIVYFGRDSNKQHKQHNIRLDELVVYVPEWLTVSVLGSIVQLMRKQKDRLKKNNDLSSGNKPIVLHSELIKPPSVWRNIPSHLRENVMEMLYSLDLGFSVSPTPQGQSIPFAERSSFFPQLLPFLPPRLLTWQATTSATIITTTTTTTTTTIAEAVYIIALNGFAMGFHGVLFSRLQSLLQSVEYGSCWQCGFLFSDVSQSILVTIHDDTQQIRICTRNSSNPSKVFKYVKSVIASLIEERYRGIRITGKFIECPCEDCKNVKWRWNSKIYDQAFNDIDIKSLCKDTTSRADLAIAIGRYNQPDGSPHLFNIEDIMNTPSSQENFLCKKSHNAVLVSSLKRLIEQPVPSIPVSATFRARVALVVGNDKYVERRPLNHGVGDAVAVRNRLRELEFDTIEVFNGTKDMIDDAITKYKLAVKAHEEIGTEPGVLSVIYFSGHADQEKGANFYVSLDNKHITVQDVVPQIKILRKKKPYLSFPVCVILDACRTGKDPFGFQEPQTDLDYLFLYSCRSGQSASDGFLQDEHSPFATAMLRHLQRGRSLRDICEDVIIDTKSEGQQPMFVNSCRKLIIL